MTANGSLPTRFFATSTAWPRPSGSLWRTYATLTTSVIRRISSSCSCLAALIENVLQLERDVEMILHRALAAARDEQDVVDAGLDGLLDAVLNDRLVDEHQHFLRQHLGRREKACPEAGGRKDRLSNRSLHACHRIAGTIGVMLDPAFLRDNLEAVRTGLQKRGVDLAGELEDLATLETRRRRLLPEIEGLKREQNSAGDEVARAKRQGLDARRSRKPAGSAHSRSSN